MTKISVIITTYNSSAFIGGLLDSILSQRGINDLFEIETIVVDDVSQDNTWELINKYTGIITLQNEKNSGGPNKGRNVGLEIATGDYICIADHDDTWDEDRISNILPYLGRADIISSGYRININNEVTEMCSTSPNGYIYYGKNVTFRQALLRSKEAQKIYLGSLVFTKELKNIRFEEKYGAVDFDWKFRLFENRDSIEICKSLYSRNIVNTNLSLNESYRKKDYEYSLSFLETLRKKYPTEVDMAIKKVNATMGKYYFRIGKMIEARKYFKKSESSLRIGIYYMSSYIGSSIVRKMMKW